MAGRRRGHPGGIESLLDLLSRYGEALSYDMITLGRSIHDIGTARLPWVDLLAIIRNLPPSSALGRALTSESEEEAGDSAWDLHAHLLATIADSVATLIWLVNGGKRRDRPKPIPRPGLRPTRYGRALMTIEQAQAFMEARRQGRRVPRQ